MNNAVTGPVDFLSSNGSPVKGGLATAYSIVLAGMVFMALKTYELEEVDTYLVAGRGSVISIAKALISIRNPNIFLVVLYILVSAVVILRTTTQATWLIS